MKFGKLSTNYNIQALNIKVASIFKALLKQWLKAKQLR